MWVRKKIQTVSRQTKLAGEVRRISVVAGIIRKDDNTVLIANRRGEKTLTDCWEFPGGKLETGESSKYALQRELHEELGIHVLSAEYICHIQHDYPELNVGIDFFLVTDWQGSPTGCEGQQIKWVESSTLDQQSLLPANAPVIEMLRQI